MGNFSSRYKLLLFFIVFLGVGFFTANAATLSLSPSSTSTTVGNIFSVNILLNTQGTSTNGVDIRYLNFPASLLEVQDDGGAAGIQIAAGTLMPQTITNTADNSLGRIEFSQLGSYGSGYNGNGTLATIRFEALSAGTASVTFNFTSGATTDTNVDAGGVDILTSVTNGSYIISAAPDITAPTISSVATSSLTQSSVIVSWTTNETATTRIDYGLTSAYGSQTSFDSTLVTNHSQTISGLTTNTLYHFRARSADAANNLTTSNDYTFTTLATADTTPPTRSNGLPNSQLSAGTTQTTLSLTTNENATCKYSLTAGTSYLAMVNTFSTTGAMNHSTNISGLTNGSSYNYYVRCQDTASPPNANTTDFPISFSVASGGGGGDTTPPIISNVAVSSIASSSAMISWTTNESATSRINYGLTSSYGSQTILDSNSATNHSQIISNLTANTLYHFQALSSDAAGNSAASSDSTFTTLSVPIVDSQAPTIPGNLTANSISSSQIDLSWIASTDNVGVAGYRIYRCTGSSCSPTVQIATTTTATSYSNTNLNPSTSYTYAISAYDASGNASSQSAVSTATTLSLNTTPPELSNGSPTGQLSAGTTQATLSLTTNENATCRYSTTAGTAYAAMINIISTTPTTNHSVNISGFSDGNSYIYYAACQNTDGYANTSDYSISFSIATASSGGGGDSGGGGGGGGGGSVIVPPSGGGGGGGGITVSNPPSGGSLTPVQIRNLVIRKLNGILIAEKEVVGETTLNFEAQVFDSSNQKVRLEVELRKFDEQFTNAPTLFSEYVDSGKIAIIIRGGLVDGSYRLRARARRYPNPNIVGAEVVSEWLWFGDQNTRDFTVLASQQPIQIPAETGFKYYFGSNMSLGMKNKDVEALQKVLNLEGVYPENIVSGYFGNLTKKAVIAFQQKYIISPAIGIAGPLTRTKLNALYAPKEGVVPVISGELVGPFSIGMQSEQVKLLQTTLAKNKEIYPEGITSGYYGNLTIKAVQKFQCQYMDICSGAPYANGYGLSGPKTRAKINEVLGK